MVSTLNRVSGVLGVLALAALLANPSPASAQQGIDLEIRGGFAFPVGDLDQSSEVGPMGGAGVSYELTERWGLRADLDVDILPGQDVAGFQEFLADVRLWHYHGGVEYLLTDASTMPWTIRARGSVGITVYDTDPFLRPDGTVRDVTVDYFSTAAGGQVGYRLSEQFSVGLGGQFFFTFADEGETGIVTQMFPAVDAVDTIITSTTYAFLRWHLDW